MKKSKIYTRTGDQGSTGLVSGARISKGHERIDLYGDLDELNSRLGVVTSMLENDVQYSAILTLLHKIQSAIFDLGSNLACEAENRSKFKLPQVSEEAVSELEIEIDRLDNHLEPLKNFILPGGTITASHIHLCRTSARSIERKLVRFGESSNEELPKNGVVYLNRLSDFFFVLARYVNKMQNGSEKLWQPGN